MAKKFISQFTGEEIESRLAAVSDKAGFAFYFNANDNNSLYSFESREVYEQWLSEGGSADSNLILFKTPFDFAGEMRRLVVENKLSTLNPYFTTNKKSAILRFGYVSQFKSITDVNWTDYDENALVTIEVDKGFTGEYVTIVEGKQLLNGREFEVDVYPHITNGDNKVRVTIIGETSGTKGTLTYTVSLTSMYMLPSSSGVNWHQVLIEGNQFSLGTFNIGGSVSKVVKLRVSYTNPSGHITYTDYEKNIGTNIYVNTAYAFAIDLVGKYPKDENGNPVTGVCKAEIWVEAGTASSDHLVYYLMFIAKGNTSTAKLACINDVHTIKNGASSKLFSYSVFDGSKGLTEAEVRIGYDNTEIYKDTLEVETQTKHDLVAEIQQDSEVAMFELNASVNVVDGAAMYANIPVDNSANYPATSGYTFYFNAANRNNGESEKNVLNEVNKTRIKSEWENISWVDGLDGYTADEDGRKGLRIPAKCYGTIDVYPFAQLGAQELSIEIQYKISNSADAEEPVITLCDNRSKDAFVTNTFNGLAITSNRIVLNKKNSTNNIDGQSYNLKDGEIVHFMLTIVPSYKGYGRLAQVYINGSKKISFEYESGDFSLIDAKLKLGSQTADLTLYKMRVYPFGFTWDRIFQNYVNTYPVYEEKALIYEAVKGIITENFDIDYEKCKAKGLNIMVVEMLTDDGQIPSNVTGVESGNSNLLVKIHNAIEGEYDGAFEQFFNIGAIQDYWIEQELCEGQGTTAMTYARWNFRWKMGKAHDKRRITAKKNVASAMHSHKMGATRMFNDVFKWLVANNRHLDSGAIRTSSGENDIAAKRLAVYQYPVFGFQKSKDDEGNDKYDFIGLYTIGPDKGDKETFGFDENKDTLIHLEGADHGVASVGFEYPWSKMDFEDEVLGGIGKNGIEGAWEVGAAYDLDVAKDDENYNKAAVKAVLDDEWKPAYEVAQKNNPYVMGLTSDEFNDMQTNPSEFRSRVVSSGEYKGLPYSYFEFYKQGEYLTYHFDVQYETFQPLGVNAVTDLGLVISGKTELEIESAIRQERRAQFKANVGNYWNVWDSIYHYTFMQWLGATDNFMKNTYPYKFKKLEDGGKWRWRQDDLDTIADVNNRGAAVKKYSILVGDIKDGNPIYVGYNSVFWTLIRECYPSEVREMGKNILDALAAISESGKTNKIEAVLEYFNKRWFAYAQNYFGIAGYNEDTEWTYEDIWGMKKAGNSYQTADPLLQALGSHYEAEYRWFYLRTIFFASLVGFGDFADYEQKFTGQISYRAGAAYTFNIVPAIDFSPMCILGANSSYATDYQRKMAGENVVLSYSYLDDTDIYLKGAHYITDLGDLSALKTGQSSKELIFAARMLRNIKIGDEDASKVTTNVNMLTLTECPSLEEIDARNAVNIGGTLNLANSPRISKALLEGTSITNVSLPNGAKIETLHLPNSITGLSFVKLPKLGGSGLVIGSYANLSSLRLEENPLMDDFEMLRKAYRESQKLSNIRVIGFDNQGTSADITMLKKLATESTESGVYRYSGITADGLPMATEMKSDAKRQYAPVIQGTLNIFTPVYKSELDKVEELYNADTLNINSDKYYIEFEDEVTKQTILDAGIGDGIGVLQKGSEYVDADEVVRQFVGTETNTGILQTAPITKFNELQYFTHPSLDLCMAFKDNHTIEEVTMPRWENNKSTQNGIFWNAVNLKKVTYQEGQKFATISHRSFENTQISEIGFDISDCANFGTACFKNCKNLKISVTLNAQYISGGGEFFNGSGIENLYMPNYKNGLSGNFAYNTFNLKRAEMPCVEDIVGSFFTASSLSSILLNADLKSIGKQAFQETTNLVQDIELNKLESMGDLAFYKSGITSFKSDSIVLSNMRWFGYCPNIKSIQMKSLTGVASTFAWASSVETVDIPSALRIEQMGFQECVNLNDINMPMVEFIGDGAFQDCKNLKTINCPKLKTCDSYAFIRSGLEGVINLPSLESVGMQAFANVNIEEFHAENLTTISGNSNFGNCKKLKVFNAPKLTMLTQYMFMQNSLLTTANLGKVTEFGMNCFYECYELIPNFDFSETISISHDAFFNVYNLGGDVILPKCETIGQESFYGTAITSLYAPNLIRINGGGTFGNCSKLTRIEIGDKCVLLGEGYKVNFPSDIFIIHTKVPPTGAFGFNTKTQIYVPDDCVDAYKSATIWVSYANNIHPISQLQTN